MGCSSSKPSGDEAPGASRQPAGQGRPTTGSGVATAAGPVVRILALAQQQEEEQQQQQQEEQAQQQDILANLDGQHGTPAAVALRETPAAPPAAAPDCGGGGDVGLQHAGGGGNWGDLQDWLVDDSELELLRRVAIPCRVYLAKWREALVAVKSSYAESNQELAHFRQECALLASLNHPNVIRFWGVCIKPPAMIMEYCEKMSLYDVLHAAATHPQRAAMLTWQRRLAMALDVTKGMAYLHRKGLLHRDLKSPNLLVDSSWRVKVTDVGLAIRVDDAEFAEFIATNPKWLAPEVISGGPPTTKSDVFSFGVVLWELLTLSIPWSRQSPFFVIGRAVDGERPPIPEASKLPGAEADNRAFAAQLPAYVDLIQRCWAQNPALRPDFSEIERELGALLVAHRGAWSPATHHRWPDSFKAAVRTVLLAAASSGSGGGSSTEGSTGTSGGSSGSGSGGGCSRELLAGLPPDVLHRIIELASAMPTWD